MSTFLESGLKLGQNDQRIIDFSFHSCHKEFVNFYIECIAFRPFTNSGQNLEKDIITPRHSFSAFSNIGGTQKSISFHHFSKDCQENFAAKLNSLEERKSHP